MLVKNNLLYSTILWALGHPGNIYLVNSRTEQVERALGTEIGILKVQMGRVEVDVEYLKARRVDRDRQESPAQQESLRSRMAGWLRFCSCFVFTSSIPTSLKGDLLPNSTRTRSLFSTKQLHPRLRPSSLSDSAQSAMLPVSSAPYLTKTK